METEDLGEKFFRNEVLDGSKAIYEKGLVDFGEGNVSMRLPLEKELFITPTRNDYSRLTSEDIVRISFKGQQLNEGRKPSSEYRLHVVLYNSHPNSNCVIHTHSSYASIFGVTQTEIPIIFEEMLIFLGGKIKIAPFAQSGSENLGQVAIEAMGNTSGVILTNHGVLVCGRDMQHAVKNALLIEKVAKIYWGAMQLKKDIATVPMNAQKKFLQIYESTYSTRN